MSSVWTALQSSDFAVWLSFSRWGYAAVATAHVLGIATLLGSILVLDLRLLGLARSVDRHRLAGLVVPVAAAGLLCAMASGAVLFAGGAADYAGYELFRIKMILIAVAVVLAAAAHARFGLRFERATASQCVMVGALSLVLWLSVAVSGRMIAFVHG